MIHKIGFNNLIFYKKLKVSIKNILEIILYKNINYLKWVNFYFIN